MVTGVLDWAVKSDMFEEVCCGIERFGRLLTYVEAGHRRMGRNHEDEIAQETNTAAYLSLLQ